jgi:hypothetical protein
MKIYKALKAAINKQSFPVPVCTFVSTRFTENDFPE